MKKIDLFHNPNGVAFVLRPERASRFSEGRSPSKTCVNVKPCKGVRIMRVALTGLNTWVDGFVGLRPTLKRDALSGRRKIFIREAIGE